jgi:hypothetical protein
MRECIKELNDYERRRSAQRIPIIVFTSVIVLFQTMRTASSIDVGINSTNSS